jgi:hypothetical protein
LPTLAAVHARLPSERGARRAWARAVLTLADAAIDEGRPGDLAALRLDLHTIVGRPMPP